MTIDLVHDGMALTATDGDGNVVNSVRGKTSAQLKRDHDEQRCGAWCGYCYEAGCEYIDLLEGSAPFRKQIDETAKIGQNVYVTLFYYCVEREGGFDLEKTVGLEGTKRVTSEMEFIRDNNGVPFFKRKVA